MKTNRMPSSSHPIYDEFSEPLLLWFNTHGRKDFPWQHPRSAYRVWISEIMLQQTQVKTVIPYFNRFIASFPDIQALALASEDEVLSHWSGLGYYSRARNLHKTAAIIHTDYHGEFPRDLESLIKLPGIGPSTAAAIASQAFELPTAILDGNVKRVLSRYFLVRGQVQQAATHKKLWQLANECMPNTRCADYTQAIMDLGATCCTSKNPDCAHCPLHPSCLARQQNATADYPNKKPKKTIPTKQQQFLLLHENNELIYLEKRPPTGLWGGLWCLPSIDLHDCPTTHVSNIYSLETETVERLVEIHHSFSHFHLQITALSMQIKTKPNTLTESPGRWFAPHEVSGLGLAKPVSDIIDFFITSQQVRENSTSLRPVACPRDPEIQS